MPVDGSAHALLIVPPFVKYTAGPPLGPALLAAAGEEAGHRVDVLDLNIRYLREALSPGAWGWASGLVGDHDKPGSILSDAEARFHTAIAQQAGSGEAVRALALAHEAVAAAALALARSPHGTWVRRHIVAFARPDLVGLSVLFAGQVIAGLATSIIVRDTWPGVPVVWGGAHVTALRNEIATDPRYGQWIDGFVFGYAEGSFVHLLDDIGSAQRLVAFQHAGTGSSKMANDLDGVVPRFDDLGAYDSARLTLPVQTSRGCVYGRCRFCTYPAIEGRVRLMDLRALDAVASSARSLGAAVSLKDSLLTVDRLRQVAACIAGRVHWSGCTKLHAGLDAELFRRLRDAACRTLEIGLETLDPDVQRLVDKRQSPTLLLRVLDAATGSGVALVLNLMTGFPGERASATTRWWRWLESELASRRPALRTVIEHNHFELERLAPLASSGRIRVVSQWPWSSLVSWEEVVPRAGGKAPLAVMP